MSGLLQKAKFDDCVPKTLPSSEHVNRYWDKWLGKRAAKLTPGEFCLSSTNDLLVTVLGSTTAVCFRDSQRSLMGMTHFMLPTLGISSLDRKSRRLAEDYGHFAMTNVINGFHSNGCVNGDIEAIIIGGATTWPTRRSSSLETVEFARSYLTDEGIRVTGEFVGPTLPRKVYFTDRDEMPYIRVLNEYSATIKQREDAYLRRLLADWMLNKQGGSPTLVS